MRQLTPIIAGLISFMAAAAIAAKPAEASRGTLIRDVTIVDVESGRLRPHRSVLLSQIRVSLSKVTENDPAACRELVSTCEQIDYPEAAEAFRKHAERIEKNQLHRPQALIRPY